MDNFNLENISIGQQNAFPMAQEEASFSLEPEAFAKPPQKDEICFKSCETVKTVQLKDVSLSCQGRILNLSLTIKNVCPLKRIALAVAVCEIDSCGKEYPRGLKVTTVAAHNRPCCQDITIPCMRFVFPEDISVGSGSSMCTSTRRFLVRVDAHYIDVNTGICCQTSTPCSCANQ